MLASFDIVMLKSLNIGCGQRFNPTWTNLNFNSTHPSVISHDLKQGIPFPDSSFDVVYHSHVLEHFCKAEGIQLLEECYRVLRPQGVVRIAVPDLEQIVQSYFLSLNQALSSNHQAVDNYNWILLELFDQMVRNQSGGEMAVYLRQSHIPNEAFVIERLGIEAKNLIDSGCQLQNSKQTDIPWLKRIFAPFYRFLRYGNYRYEILIKKLLTGTDYHALQVGRFRQSGEIHQWMYDRFSLKRLLEQSGFTDVIQRTATESYVPHWASFNLDTEPDGSIYKPDSLFMEAIKPST